MSSAPHLRRSRPAGALAVLALATLGLMVLPGASARAWDDPLAPILQRMDRYLQLHQVDGVTMDWRYALNPTEEIRQSVVCQLLAYVELYRLDPRGRLRLEIVRHADYLIGRLADVRSHTPFDGMLAYALLGAYETTHEPRFLETGTEVTNEMLAIPTGECVLNGGLMVALGTAEFARLAGDAGATQKTLDIIAQLAPYQNPDGSFPHWCWGSRDIHYTGWMAMELLHLRRMIADPLTDGFLATMNAFLEGRIAPDGRAVYQEPCPGVPGCTQYFYSRASGCSYDYDTRGWTVEPAYCALLFDHMGSSRYEPTMTFLDSFEHDGIIPDLYGYWPPPDDPEYPWTIADTSVVCMSIVFWTLATQVADRAERGVPVTLQLEDLIDTTSVPPEPPPAVAASRPLVARPNPARGGCLLRFSLAAPVEGSLAIYDAAGRCVEVLESGTLARGEHARYWDGRGAARGASPGGVYFARLHTTVGRDETRRIVVLR
jgi:hypothetical protein